MRSTSLRHAFKMLTCTTLLALGAVLQPAFADDDEYTNYHWAKVTRVEPLTRMVEHSEPEQHCWNEEVVYQNEFYRPQSATGTIVGGIIGGAVGNALGHKKRNKQIGTAVGAILGASIGSDLSTKRSRGDYTTRRRGYEQRCEVSHRTYYEEEITGYRVWYRYRGDTYSTRMSRKPGKKIRVRVTVEPA